MIKSVATVFETEDYGKFVLAEWNRRTDEQRVTKIKSSIAEIGFRMNPIIVNDNFEVIDGQGRLKACQELGIPVKYVVDRDAGVLECQTMNMHQTNWSITDYMRCYASMGNDSYKALCRLCDTYTFVNPNMVAGIAIGAYASGGRTLTHVKKGTFRFESPEQVEHVEALLKTLKEFSPYVAHVGGRRGFMYLALAFIIDHGARVDRLLNNFKRLYPTILPCANMRIALDELTRVYNQYARHGKANFYGDYLNYENVLKSGWSREGTMRRNGQPEATV